MNTYRPSLFERIVDAIFDRPRYVTGLVEDQAAFMRAGQQTVGEVNPEQAALYLTLIREEVAELESAMHDGSRVDTLDAIADTMVVLTGLAHSLNLPLNEGVEEVCRSNLSKIKDGVLVRREDGKILKPATYRPPLLHDIVFRHDHGINDPEAK